MSAATKPAHTPGPWIARDCELIGNSTLLATLYWHSGREAENEADARLIAAAPDLLEALKLLVADVADYPAWQRPCHALDVSRSAIARATSPAESGRGRHA